jgi:hypothetical protein
VPQLGYWLVYLKTPPGLASAFCAVVAICLLWPIARELDGERVRGSTVDPSAPIEVEPGSTSGVAGQRPGHEVTVPAGA